MCKVSGFADHAHNAAPCTKCEVTQAELFSEKSLANGIYHLLLIVGDLLTGDVGFPARDGAVHKARCFHYNTLVTEKEKEDFFKKHGSRWTEFARLKYFDLIRYTIIDPMHNWLQGTL